METNQRQKSVDASRISGKGESGNEDVSSINRPRIERAKIGRWHALNGKKESMKQNDQISESVSIFESTPFIISLSIASVAGMTSSLFWNIYDILGVMGLWFYPVIKQLLWTHLL